MGLPQDALAADAALAPGVSLALARERSAAIREVAYDLRLRLAEEPGTPITGTARVAFALEAPARVVLDFGGAAVHAVTDGQDRVPFARIQNHLVIGPESTRAGRNAFMVTFSAGEDAVHRRDGFLYTLFVPAKAHTLVPCFDQPDLKARVTLTLDVPVGWTALANGNPLDGDEGQPGRSLLRFSETPPISTYLIAFAAGELASAEVRSGRWRVRVFHRCGDPDRLERNLPDIADLHARALEWLEDYTGVPFPFGSVGMLLVPAFEFGGMEHPGAVFYQESSLLLPEHATDEERRHRAHLITHETAHMWFGDLVTMPWFDDVWLKEVFANLMAEKILAAGEPGPAEELRFFLAHYPAAYDVDRTEGTHPIRQPLDNLARASELYGPIAYQKSPIAFRDLEGRLRAEAFRTAVRTYLQRFSWRSAGWPDLLRCCEEAHGAPLAEWSHAWIETAGRPELPALEEPPRYGHVNLSAADAAALVASLGAEPSGDEVHASQRAVRWMAAWDAVCDGLVAPEAFASTLIARLPYEGEPLVCDWLAGLLRRIVWRWLDDGSRTALAPYAEYACLMALEATPDAAGQRAWFARFRALASTPDGVARLRGAWEARHIGGTALTSVDEVAVAETLAVLDPGSAHETLREQRARLADPRLQARLDAVAPALAPEPEVRADVVHAFADAARRVPESWALDALAWVHHPLRRAHAETLIEASLAILPGVQASGDIFLPQRWAHAVLQGHRSEAAAEAVDRVLRLDSLSGFHRRLILEAADDLRRQTRRGRYARATDAADAAQQGRHV